VSGYGAFARHYDALTKNIDYKRRAEYFARLVKAHMPKAKLVLDLACGTGSLAFELEQKGFEVIAADASPDMLGEAARKAAERNSRVLFLNQPMESLDLYGTVDATVCALDSVNHLGGKANWLKAFKKVALFTNPGGMFIFDANTPHKHRDILGSGAFVLETPEVFCCWRNEYRSEGHRVDVALDFFVKTNNGQYLRESELISEWAFEQAEIEAMLKEAGFEPIAAYDDDSERPPTLLSERIVYIARKA
jgi:ubiquinone/menaquinone biosynthesis C-methylase UbiE